MCAMTWLRVADDRLFRVDHLVAIDLWGPPSGGEPTDPITGEPARIMGRFLGVDGPWIQVATCPAPRGGELVTGLLSTVAAARSTSHPVAFVYGLHHDGELSSWTHGDTIPVSDRRVPALHEVTDPAPSRWIMNSSRWR
jgi:hypothetical protein